MADKVSAMLCHVPGVLLVLGDDPMPEVFDEVVRSGAMRRVHFVLDGAARSGRRTETLVARGRTAQQCMLRALLEPTSLLHGYEINGMRDEELVLMERCKALPWSRIYEEFCQRES
jgi:L-rhamnose isomerase